MRKFKQFLSNEHVRQFFKFCVVGSIGTAVDFGLLYLLVEFGHLFYLLAATISFIAAVVNNYILNKIWTFRDHSKQLFRQFGRFLIISLVGLGLNVLLLYLLVEFGHLWYILAKVLATGVVLIWNFFANKFWTFRKNGEWRMENGEC